MDAKQALNIINQVFAEFRGTRQDHELLKQAIQVLELKVETPIKE
jgi:predicted nucleotidyltransferase